MRYTKAFIAIVMMLSIATLASAREQSFGQVSDSAMVQTVKSFQALGLYEPDASKASWFNRYNLVVYSRTSRNGEQTDIVRKGNFDKELFVGIDKKIHVRRCGNAVYQIAVEQDIVCQAGQDGHAGIDGLNGRDGQDGADGAPGPRGPRGYRGARGDQGIPGEVRFVIAPRQASWRLNPSRQFYYEPGWFSASVSALLMPRTRINNSNSNSNSATGGAGGAGGSVGDITNNNANTNVNTNPNNNVINIGSGSADGSATGTGTGTSKAGNH